VRGTTSGALCALLWLAGPGMVRAQSEAEAFPPAAQLLSSRCALPACHGVEGRAGLHLDAASIYRSAVNVPATTDRRALRVSPGDPEGSLLYRKLLPPPTGSYLGPRMPLGMAPLSEEEITIVRHWIESFPAEAWGKSSPPPPRPARSFHDSFLANLPTPVPLGGRTLDFRLAHRFKESVDAAGSAGFYGLDTGAWVSLGLAYGFSDRWEAGLRHTNLEQANELWVKVTPLQQAEQGPPLSLAIVASGSNLRGPGLEHRNRAGAQVVLARRVTDWLSLMAVPTYHTPTHYLDAEDDRGTLALGAGAEWRIKENLAITTEWIGQLDGVMAPYQSASIGLSIATARHTFQLLLTNTSGTHPDLYAPGGDLDWRDGDFRIGFNLSRRFEFAR
jgi:uncharacterized beta barrel domain-containing protein DUF5777